LACAIQLALSGTSPANIAIPAMAAIHALIGIGEGLITAGALAFLLATRKDLIESTTGKSSNHTEILVGGGLIAVVLAVMSPIASSNPDGLEWVAEQQGFLGTAQDSLYNIMPDYVMPGINDPSLATIIAGIIGVLIVFSVSFGIARSEKKVPVREEVRD
jgi:cobalt/nickel transport system permease protein